MAPGRTVTLKKCSEHDLCQLQSVNGGEWEHTPQKLRLSQRLPGPKPPDVNVIERHAEEVASLARQDAYRVRVQSERVDALAERVERLVLEVGVLRDVVDRQVPGAFAQIDQRAAEVADAAQGVREMLAELADLVTNADRLQRVEELFDHLADVEAARKAAGKAVAARLDEVERLTRHEREERLQATAKAQRQIAGLAGRMDK